ncbi:MAG: acyltransferase [Rhizobacter sp.]|nr:acyltransferase [Rhizobacter sp.]
MQGMRGLALLLVILVHQSFVEQKYGHVEPMLVKTHLEQFNHAAVDAFLVISGFIIAYTTFEAFGGTRNAASFMYRRLTRIYPPWWIYSALLLPVFFLYPQLINSSEGNQVNLLESFFLFPSEHLPLIPIGWTLTFELYFYVGFAFLVALPRSRLGPMIALWAVVMLGLIAMRAAGYQGGPVFRMVSNPICLEFLLGVCVAMALQRRPAERPRLLIIAGLLMWLGGYAAYVYFVGDWLVNLYSRVLIAGVPAAFLIYGLVSLEATGRSNPMGRLKWLGDTSYSTYLCHVMIVVGIGRLWFVWGLPGQLAHWTWLIGSVVIAVFVGGLSYKYIEKPILRWAKRHDPTVARPPAAVRSTT